MPTIVEGPPIAVGYPYRLRVRLTDPETGVSPTLFPAGAELRAQVRTARNAASAVGELTTANGGLVRVSDSEIDIVMPVTITAALVPGGKAHLDIARSDPSPDEYLWFYCGIPVHQPVTRP